ncbi:ORC-CDC6 family AAA ATPase [Tsukamurella ocularis]|uniref:ORC-CDC6 family AAA ATPase n=1 Tax=Tsukamurella ocularis TaxID=1970234 RepID=UPI00216A8031|nr:hypothetical protein [Tsukamurella ocularis]MCS3781853.1 hypothetical protein [Tsukamurella ocularis]MCS3788347.1 hypothetical protein [Tsukamurella ocularis]MCS3852067.1 hypothetical protein [Tsukamurella ocularis]
MSESDSLSEEDSSDNVRQTVNESLNRLVRHFASRAENMPEGVAQDTFVSVSDVTDGLIRRDHQVLFGRRGSGKTHAFRYLEAAIEDRGDLAIFVDLRTVGSSGGMYADDAISRASRGTQLLIDVLEAVHSSLLAAAIGNDGFEGLLPHLDQLAEALTEVRVDGSLSLTSESAGSVDSSKGGSVELAADFSSKAGLKGKRERSSKKSSSTKTTLQRSGVEVPRVLFGRLTRALGALGGSISPRRVWLLLDEWSSLPKDLQPILADMFRRAMFPVASFSIKIAAIERRSNFLERTHDSANYIGFEMGSDTAASISLDERIADEVERRTFFAELLYKHLAVTMRTEFDRVLSIGSAAELANTMFGEGALEEFVRAAEGVPRDALQIVGHAAKMANTKAISRSNVHSGAHRFYLQDKELGIAGNDAAEATWRKLIRDIVDARRSRAFLVRRDRLNTSPGLLDLHDARLIHLVQSGLYTKRDPGTMYDGYYLDFGSYITMLNEIELAQQWSSNGNPWRVESGEAVLPDSFEPGLIFNPPTARKGRSR